MFGIKKTSNALAKENRAVTELIEEQRQKESIEIYRRGWCISEAACLDDASKDNLIDIAKKIYAYVYGEPE